VEELYHNELISRPSPEVTEGIAPREPARVGQRVPFTLPEWVKWLDNEIEDKQFNGVKVFDPFADDDD